LSAQNDLYAGSFDSRHLMVPFCTNNSFYIAVKTSTSILEDGHISTHADPKRGQRAGRIGQRAASMCGPTSTGWVCQSCCR